MTPLRVLIADDHALVRAGMASLLREMGDIEVVAETGNGQDALQLMREKRPDVALVDISMPGLNGSTTASASGPASCIRHSNGQNVCSRRNSVSTATNSLFASTSQSADRSDVVVIIRIGQRL